MRATLSLPLLVLGVLADHAHGAAPLDDLAPITHSPHRGTYLHVRFSSLPLVSCPPLIPIAAGSVPARDRRRTAPPGPDPREGCAPPGGEPCQPGAPGPCARPPTRPGRARWEGVRSPAPRAARRDHSQGT